jgi:hypothetical protein
MDKTSSSKLLIKGGTVVNADRQQQADIYIEDGVVVEVQPNIKVCGHICFAFKIWSQFTQDDF